MKKHELQNEQLDEIGRKLLEARRLQADELEGIVSAPHLFSGVKARIEAEQAAAAATAAGKSAVSFFASALNWQNAGAAFAAAIIGVIGVGAMTASYLYSRQTVATDIANIGSTANVVQHKPEQPEAKPLSAAVTETKTAVDEEAEEAEGTPAKVTTALYRPASKPELGVRANFKKRAQPRDAAYESDGEFYPLTYTNGSGEISPGAQIVRVELPRSSLFAMGIDLPDADRAGTVKADLLISSDGVAKGFRLVR